MPKIYSQNLRPPLPQKNQILSSLFFYGIEPFSGRRFSMSHSTKRCSSIFDLGLLTPKIYSPKFGTKSPISRFVQQTDRRCLGLLGGFRGWPIHRNHTKCCGPTLVAMATKFGQFLNKSRISRLLCQIDWICLDLPGGPTLVAMAMTFALGAESSRLLACLIFLFALHFAAQNAAPLNTFRLKFQCWQEHFKFLPNGDKCYYWGYTYFRFWFCKLPCTGDNCHKTWIHKLFRQLVSEAAEVLLQLTNWSFVVWQQRKTKGEITPLSLTPKIITNKAALSTTNNKNIQRHRLTNCEL